MNRSSGTRDQAGNLPELMDELHIVLLAATESSGRRLRLGSCLNTSKLRGGDMNRGTVEDTAKLHLQLKEAKHQLQRDGRYSA